MKDRWAVEIISDPDEARRYNQDESCRILSTAMYMALNEIVQRGFDAGVAAVGRRFVVDRPIFAAVDAYYVSRSAYNRASNERMS